MTSMDLPEEPGRDGGAETAGGELEERVAEAARSATEAAGEEVARLEGQISSVQSRARRLRAEKEGREAQSARQSLTGASSGKGLGAGLSAAYALIGAPIVGYLLGYAADRGTDSNVFGLVGFCLGAAAAVAYAVRVLNRQ